MDDEPESESKVMTMQKSSILDLIKNPTGRGDAANRDAPASPTEPPPPVQPPPVTLADADFEVLPLPGDVYLAHSRTANKPQTMLCLVQKPPALTCLAYGDMRFIDLVPPDKPGGGPVLLLKFIGVAEVRLEGRNLDKLIDYLRRHCLAWLREQLPTRGNLAADDGSVVITGIRVKALG